MQKNSNRKKTWINKQIISNYTKLYKIGKAKSVECYYEKKLVGGLYGIIIGSIFCGESMFSLEKNASKISLAYLAAHLIEGGFKFIDTQFYSNHLKQFGTKKIIRNDYKEILLSNKKNLKMFPEKISDDILDYLANSFLFKKIGSSNKHSSRLISYIALIGKFKYCEDLNIQPRNSSFSLVIWVDDLVLLFHHLIHLFQLLNILEFLFLHYQVLEFLIMELQKSFFQ